MRLALIADSHFRERSRFLECIDIHHWIAEDAKRRGCTAWKHAGDVYDSRTTPKERAAVADWTFLMAQLVGEGVIVEGNHDPVGDLPLLERLELDSAVTVVQDARHVVLSDGAESVDVACMAWPRRGNVHAMLPEGATATDVNLAARDALLGVLRGLGATRAPTIDTCIFLGHVMARGSKTSTGQPLVGCDFELSLADLSLVGADFYALGHIHLGQDWEIDGAPVVYPSSPRRTSFGETEPKYYVIIDTNDGGKLTWERIQTPARQMVHLEGIWRPDHGLELEQPGLETAEGFANAEFRLRYSVAAEHREAARSDVAAEVDRLNAAGAHSIQVEERVDVVSKARAPEIVTAATLGDKLETMWRVRGEDLDEQRRGSLIAKLNELEHEHALGAD